ncbi:MAG TPA: hypothetical protein VG820_04925, partial [Fimbriimonadaceae bacterium]|nr:hypothetical protein [Fimbriimonadaceae bacterium]
IRRIDAEGGLVRGVANDILLIVVDVDLVADKIAPRSYEPYRGASAMEEGRRIDIVVILEDGHMPHGLAGLEGQRKKRTTKNYQTHRDPQRQGALSPAIVVGTRKNGAKADTGFCQLPPAKKTWNIFQGTSVNTA